MTVEIPDFITQMDGYDPSYVCEFCEEWCDYEENGWICIFSKNEKYFSLKGGHSVMAEGSQETRWSDLEEISLEEAMEEIDYWIKIEDIS